MCGISLDFIQIEGKMNLPLKLIDSFRHSPPAPPLLAKTIDSMIKSLRGILLLKQWYIGNKYSMLIEG